VNRRIYKSPTERIVSGVAGGVAEYFDVDPSIVRVVWALLAIITGGVFLVLYLVMWVVVPEGTGPAGGPVEGTDPVTGQPADASPSTWSAQPVHRAGHRSGSGPWVFGLILIGLGLYFLAREYLPDIDTDRLWPLGLVVLGLLLLLAAIRRRPA
jgi:phage shock protein PspC (stress-responsive transcriptional regulator)